MCEIRTAPHPHESVYTCYSSPSALFLNTSNKVKPAGNIVFPGHLQNIPVAPLWWPPATTRAAHLLTSSFLSLHQLFIYDRELPYYVKGCSGKGSCLKASWNLSTDCKRELSTCLFGPSENSNFFLRHDFPLQKPNWLSPLYNIYAGVQQFYLTIFSTNSVGSGQIPGLQSTDFPLHSL